MKLVVGLGNPGKIYERTRHNVGFLVLDEFQTEISKLEFINSKQVSDSNFQLNKKFESEVIKYDDLVMAKPITFMNKTGVAVSSLAAYYKIYAQDIYIIHDDLDIALGEYKIQLGKGPKVHNGIRSIEKKLGTNNFWRVRVGIENREAGSMRIAGEDYVLQVLAPEEQKVIMSVTKDIVNELTHALF